MGMQPALGGLQNQTESTMARALGIDDSVTTCDCCGKSGLKYTVAMELDSGEIVHYGCVCAARNTGKAQKTITSEIKAERARKIELARGEWKKHPANFAYRARLNERDSIARETGVRMVGTVAMEFVRETSAAADAAQIEIAGRYSLTRFEFDCLPA